MAGLALGQVVAMWLGQGTYYVLLLIGSFTAYRTVLAPINAATPIVARLASLALHLGGVFAWAGGFAAAGILPRIEFVNASNLSAGYRDSSPIQGDFSFEHALTFLLWPTQFYYAGISIVVLALASLWLARGRILTPYFAAAGIVALILATGYVTPLHAAFYLLLPSFEDLHSHASVRILLLFYPMAALLAGAAVASLHKWPIAAGIVLAIVVVDLIALGPFTSKGVGRPVDLRAYYDEQGAAAFLESTRASSPNRYFGYDPEYSVDWHGEEMRYVWQLFEPETTALLVNNRATLLGLEDLQGYNPVQLQRYVELIDRLNGEAQEYHGRYILPSGLASPLLDLLNARYIVIPTAFAADRSDLQTLMETHPVVYRDEMVQIVENRDAFPRAWLVHEARQVAPGAALDLIASGAVDARTTALLETAPPPLTPAADPSQDLVVVEHSAPDLMRLRARSDAASLLVLSEMYYPAWNAYVDGAPTPIFIADHALRAVALPAGEHVVELRYESTALRAGLIISVATYGAFLLLCAVLAGRLVRPGAFTRSSPLDVAESNAPG